MCYCVIELLSSTQIHKIPNWLGAQETPTDTIKLSKILDFQNIVCVSFGLRELSESISLFIWVGVHGLNQVEL